MKNEPDLRDKQLRALSKNLITVICAAELARTGRVSKDGLALLDQPFILDTLGNVAAVMCNLQPASPERRYALLCRFEKAMLAAFNVLDADLRAAV